MWGGQAIGGKGTPTPRSGGGDCIVRELGVVKFGGREGVDGECLGVGWDGGDDVKITTPPSF